MTPARESHICPTPLSREKKLPSTVSISKKGNLQIILLSHKERILPPNKVQPSTMDKMCRPNVSIIWRFPGLYYIAQGGGGKVYE